MRRLAPEWLRRLRRSLRRKRHLRRSRAAGPIAPDELRSTLVALGVRPGGFLMVHSSMEALQPLGSAQAVLDALRAAVGPQGTLVMPTFPFEGRMDEYVAAGPVFDPARTPSRMGLLTEVFRRLPGASRSIHPTHPVAALGPRAHWLTAGHETCDTTFGPGTPIAKLYEENGQVLLLGVDAESLTLVHVAEDLMGPSFPVPVVLRERVEMRVQGTPHGVRVRVHAPDAGRRRRISRIVAPLEARDVARHARMRHIRVSLFEARGVVEYLLSEAREGRTIYGGI